MFMFTTATTGRQQPSHNEFVCAVSPVRCGAPSPLGVRCDTELAPRRASSPAYAAPNALMTTINIADTALWCDLLGVGLDPTQRSERVRAAIATGRGYERLSACACAG